MSGLLPCPFCGGEPREVCYSSLAYVECTDCDTRKSSWGPESTTADGTPLNGLNGLYWCDVLAARWNARAAVATATGKELAA